MNFVSCVIHSFKNKQTPCGLVVTSSFKKEQVSLHRYKLENVKKHHTQVNEFQSDAILGLSNLLCPGDKIDFRYKNVTYVELDILTYIVFLLIICDILPTTSQKLYDCMIAFCKQIYFTTCNRECMPKKKLICYLNFDVI